MARLVPEVTGRGLGSTAEKKLAERFRSELDADHVVMHSVGLVRHKTKRWAEADFVVVGPEGVFCIEVKGGRVARHDGVWSFTDRHGHVDEKYEGPFDQAGAAAGALQAWLRDAGFRRADDSLFQVGYGVITPDCVLDVVAPDVEPRILSDQRDTGSMADYLKQLGLFWQERLGTSPLLTSDVRSLADAVRPDFEATLTRSLRTGLIEDELVRFTERQQEVIAGLAENRRVRVRGAAGTGKTLLAVAEARRLAAEGGSVLLACHTKALAEWLIGVLIDEPAVTVCTAGSLMSGIVSEAGLDGEIPDATPDAVFDLFLPELALRVLRSGSVLRRFDSLVVDEAQDLLRGDSMSVLDSVLVGGLANGVWRLFEDPNQNIFGAPSKEARKLLAAGGPVRFRLDRNCRNTRQIVEMSALLSGSSVNAASEVDGPEPYSPANWDQPWQGRALGLVDAFLADGCAPDDLVVLTMTAAQRDALVERSEGRLTKWSAPGCVRCSTVAGFKGLEATGVVLAGLWALDEPHLRQAAYVGSTRARVLLAVVLPESAEPSWRLRIREYAVAAAKGAQSDASS